MRSTIDDGSLDPTLAVPEAPRPGRRAAADDSGAGLPAGPEDGVPLGDDVIDEDEERLRRIAVSEDGGPIVVSEPMGELDGIVDVGEPISGVESEDDVTQASMLSPEDVGAFVETPAPYDPLLNQAEESNPVFGGQTFRQFGIDPFAPLGMPIGSFLLFTTLENYYDFNSNLFASPDAVGDSSLVVRPAARLTSNWSRHALELRGSGDLSFHNQYPSEDDRAYMLEALGRIDVTSRTNVQGYYGHELSQEGRSAINANTTGSRPNITVDRFRSAVNHRFNRLSVQLRGNIIDTSYGDDIFDDFVQSNADRNYTLYEQGVRPKWEFSPYLFLFSDISLNQRDYDVAATSDGILRSSTGERYRVGVSFGEIGEILRGDISLGYGRQTPNSRELPIIDGLLIDANLSWQATPLTAVQFTAFTDVAETTTAGSGGVLERNYGLEVRHNISTRLIGIAGLGFMTRDFVGADIHESQFSAAVGAEYYLNRYAVLFSRYQYYDFDSSQPDGSFKGNEVQAGVRLRH